MEASSSEQHLIDHSQRNIFADDVLQSLQQFTTTTKMNTVPKDSSNLEDNDPLLVHSHSENLNKMDINCSGDSGFESQEPITSSYNDQWKLLFCSNQLDSMLTSLKEMGVHGQLRNCHFRSICWRLYLGVLSPDSRCWTKEVTAWRQRYNQLRSEHLIDPRQNCAIDDPLSQSNDSPWHRYFLGEADRRQIGQDVMRTFPELKFFNDSNVQELLVRVLYCYSQDCSLGYRQGMHEILAPLVFVLHSDHLDLSQASEQGSANVEVIREAQVLLNPDYLEHDAYAMFFQIMNIISTWYRTKENTATNMVSKQQFPFQNNNVSPDTSNYAVDHLNYIHSTLLKKYDLELFLHLERLEIVPQMYGLRWLRLLFGREFPLQDLLVLWDTIFSIGSNFVLTDYLYVSMLTEIRQLLLRGDFASCLCLMMRYPPGVDINYVIRTALHLYQPIRYSKPQDPIGIYQRPMQPPGSIASKKRQLKVTRNKTITGLETGVNLIKFDIGNKISNLAKKNMTSPTHTASTSSSSSSFAHTRSSPPEESESRDLVSLEASSPPPRELTTLSPVKTSSSRRPTSIDGSGSTSTPILSTPVSHLCDNMSCIQHREMCHHCATILRTSCRQISSYLLDAMDGDYASNSHNVPVDLARCNSDPLSSNHLDQLQVALAGVKQVLYMLSGNLTFNNDNKPQLERSSLNNSSGDYELNSNQEDDGLQTSK